MNTNSFSVASYCASRFIRLYVVLLPALLLTVFFDNLGIKYDNLGIYNNSVHIATLDFSVIERISIPHFLVSLLMLQNIILPPLGSNSPLWSLNYEFWYYILFPIIYIPVFSIKHQKQATKQILVHIVLLIILFIILPLDLLKYFILWLSGILAVFLKFKNKFATSVALALFFITLLIAQIPRASIGLFESDILIGITFSILISSFPEIKSKSQFFIISEKLASFSYTLYLIHLPFLLCIVSIINNIFDTGLKMRPSLLAVYIFIFVLIMTYIFSYALAILTEFKTPLIKPIIKNLLVKYVRHSL